MPKLKAEMQNKVLFKKTFLSALFFLIFFTTSCAKDTNRFTGTWLQALDRKQEIVIVINGTNPDSKTYFQGLFSHKSRGNTVTYKIMNLKVMENEIEFDVPIGGLGDEDNAKIKLVLNENKQGEKYLLGTFQKKKWEKSGRNNELNLKKQPEASTDKPAIKPNQDTPEGTLCLFLDAMKSKDYKNARKCLHERFNTALQGEYETKFLETGTLGPFEPDLLIIFVQHHLKGEKRLTPNKTCLFENGEVTTDTAKGSESSDRIKLKEEGGKWLIFDFD